MPKVEAYLDIETTGLFPGYHVVTVVGLYVISGAKDRFVQLVGEEVRGDNLLSALDGVDVIYTYNGSRFDLPFLDRTLGLDLTCHFRHHDLMYDCWRCNLYGGFKAVEQQLGIQRELKGISGWDAVMLWQRYRHDGDLNALTTLLKYNKEDVLNLKVLRQMLGVV